MIRIRRARNRLERALVVTLQLQTMPWDTPIDPDNGGWWWLAWDGTEPVGFAGMRPSGRFTDAVYLCRAGVLRSHRGRGLQKRLLRARLAEAARCGFSYAVTDCRRDNYASANSLARTGFQLYEPAQPWSFHDALYWRKKISN